MKQVFSFILLVNGTCFLFAQSAEEIDRLLLQSEMKWKDVCMWTFASAGQPYTEHDAVFYALKYKAISPNVSVEAGADLAGFALLIMRAYNIKGGLFYSIFHNKRYAFREMLYLGIFKQEDDPADSFSGARFLQILRNMQVFAGVK